MTPAAANGAARLIAAALLLGGLRDPRLAALAGAAAWAAVWRERPPLGPAAPWLPWLGWAALCALGSVQPLSAPPKLSGWALALACVSLAASWDGAARERWLRSYWAAALALAAAALYTGAGRGWGSEMTGLMPPHYNYTACALAGAAAAAGAWLLHPRGPQGAARLLPAAVLGAGLLSLSLSRSRAAWTGLGFAACVWAFRRWGARAAGACAAAAALGAGALAVGLLPSAVEDALLKRYRTHADARVSIWRSALESARERPLLGTGPGAFAVGYRRHPAPMTDGAARWSMGADYAHSEPLHAAAETGWPGLALWLLAAGWSLAPLLRRADGEPSREAAAAAGAALTAPLLFDNLLQVPALAAAWLVSLAAASPRPAGPRRWPRAVAAAGAALACAAWVPAFLASGSPLLAARLYPADPEPRERLAQAAMGAGRLAEADAHWAALEALEPFNAIHPWRRASLAGALGHWARAEPLAARAVALEPGFIGARLVRAEALARLGRRREAREELEAARRSAAREGPDPLSGYDRTVRRLDPVQLERVSALAGR